MWKPILQRALQRNRAQAQARYLQLATITPDGMPACRTVVFRGFLHDATNHLLAITDARSAKTHDLAANHHAAVAWYLPKTREQFRLSARVLMVGAAGPLGDWRPTEATDDASLADARVQLWRGLSDKARAQFLWPHPGLERNLPDSAWDDEALPVDPNAPCTCGASAITFVVWCITALCVILGDDFVMLVMEVLDVDHLQLFSNRRKLYKRKEGEWTAEEVNP